MTNLKKQNNETARRLGDEFGKLLTDVYAEGVEDGRDITTDFIRPLTDEAFNAGRRDADTFTLNQINEALEAIKTDVDKYIEFLVEKQLLVSIAYGSIVADAVLTLVMRDLKDYSEAIQEAIDYVPDWVKKDDA